MNKKIKISLFGVLLTCSLAGVATTILVCYGSEVPELSDTEITVIIFITSLEISAKYLVSTLSNPVIKLGFFSIVNSGIAEAVQLAIVVASPANEDVSNTLNKLILIFLFINNPLLMFLL